MTTLVPCPLKSPYHAETWRYYLHWDSRCPLCDGKGKRGMVPADIATKAALVIADSELTLIESGTLMENLGNLVRERENAHLTSADNHNKKP